VFNDPASGAGAGRYAVVDLGARRSLLFGKSPWLNRLRPLVGAACLLLSVGGQSVDASGKTGSLNAELVHAGELTVATSGVDPPLTSVNPSGDVIGFWPDMVTRIATRLHLGVKLIKIPWTGSIPGLAAHAFDVGDGGMLETPERLRARDFIMSEPFLETGLTVLVRRDAGIKGWRDLRDKVLGGVQGEAEFADVVRYLNRHGWRPSSTLGFSGRPEGLLGLMEHRVQGLALDSSTAAYTLKASPQGRDLVMIRPIIEPIAVGTAISGQEHGVARAINGLIKQMLRDGTVKRLARKWYGTTAVVYSPPRS
jgi:polar amino acid transport system substrate-binding protein